MVKEKVVSVTIAIPKSYRDLLQKMALEESLKDPEILGILENSNVLILSRANHAP